MQDFIAAGRNMGVSSGRDVDRQQDRLLHIVCRLRKSTRFSMTCCLSVSEPGSYFITDIDIDFDDDGRGESASLGNRKYGREKVAHIIT